MKIRPIHLLLELLLQEYRKYIPTKSNATGICSVLGQIYVLQAITDSEHHTLQYYIDVNLPERKYNRPFEPFVIYSFPYGDLEPRVKWLEEQIELTKPKPTSNETCIS